MCLLSTALMLYGLVRGYGDDFSWKSCAILAIGVILCALSYYNAYGSILGSILLFAAHFLQKEDGKWRYDGKAFLKKGFFISAFVLLCISWSFIRNYFLYDGDIIGLTTKENFVKSFGIARETYYSQGQSLFYLLLRTGFFSKLRISFIACYGSETLRTWRSTYWFYSILFIVGILSMMLCRDKGAEQRSEKIWSKILFHVAMILCMITPLILLIQYAYTVDYQAQGRYLMPGLIPFM